MGASVRVEAGALTEPRFAVFARELAKLGAWRVPRKMPRQFLVDLGRGVAERVWSYCTERGTDLIERALVDEIIGIPEACSALVSARLANEIDPQRVRIRGGSRLFWLAKKRNAGKQGAEKRWGGDSTPIADPMGELRQKECPTVTAPAPAPVKSECGTEPSSVPASEQSEFDLEVQDPPSSPTKPIPGIEELSDKRARVIKRHRQISEILLERLNTARSHVGTKIGKTFRPFKPNARNLEPIALRIGEDYSLADGETVLRDLAREAIRTKDTKWLKPRRAFGPNVFSRIVDDGESFADGTAKIETRPSAVDDDTGGMRPAHEVIPGLGR